MKQILKEKLFILGILLFVLILTSCADDNKTTEINGGYEKTQNVFDAREVNIGDSINNLIISSLNVTSIESNEYYASVQFNGEMKLSGELNIFENSEVSSEGWGLGNYFQPDEETSIKVPALNYESTRTGFTIEDNMVGQLKELTSGKYEVTLIVEGYQIWSLGKGQENKAKLLEIIESKKLNDE